MRKRSAQQSAGLEPATPRRVDRETVSGSFVYAVSTTERALRSEILPPGVHDGGPWRGPSVEEWVERIAHGSTPQREYDEQGRFQPWIRRDVA